MRRIGIIANSIEDLEIWSKVLYLNNALWIFEREFVDGEEVYTIYTEGNRDFENKLIAEFENLKDLTTSVNSKF